MKKLLTFLTVFALLGLVLVSCENISTTPGGENGGSEGGESGGGGATSTESGPVSFGEGLELQSFRVEDGELILGALKYLGEEYNYYDEIELLVYSLEESTFVKTLDTGDRVSGVGKKYAFSVGKIEDTYWILYFYEKESSYTINGRYKLALFSDEGSAVYDVNSECFDNEDVGLGNLAFDSKSDEIIAGLRESRNEMCRISISELKATFNRIPLGSERVVDVVNYVGNDAVVHFGDGTVSLINENNYVKDLGSFDSVDGWTFSDGYAFIPSQTSDNEILVTKLNLTNGATTSQIFSRNSEHYMNESPALFSNDGKILSVWYEITDPILNRARYFYMVFDANLNVVKDPAEVDPFMEFDFYENDDYFPPKVWTVDSQGRTWVVFKEDYPFEKDVIKAFDENGSIVSSGYSSGIVNFMFESGDYMMAVSSDSTRTDVFFLERFEKP